MDNQGNQNQPYEPGTPVQPQPMQPSQGYTYRPQPGTVDAQNQNPYQQPQPMQPQPQQPQVAANPQYPPAPPPQVNYQPPQQQPLPQQAPAQQYVQPVQAYDSPQQQYPGTYSAAPRSEMLKRVLIVGGVLVIMAAALFMLIRSITGNAASVSRFQDDSLSYSIELPSSWRKDVVSTVGVESVGAYAEDGVSRVVVTKNKQRDYSTEQKFRGEVQSRIKNIRDGTAALKTSDVGVEWYTTPQNTQAAKVSYNSTVTESGQALTNFEYFVQIDSSSSVRYTIVLAEEHVGYDAVDEDIVASYAEKN